MGSITYRLGGFKDGQMLWYFMLYHHPYSYLISHEFYCTAHPNQHVNVIYFYFVLDAPFGNILNWGDADLWEISRIDKIDVETSDFCSPAPAKTYIMFPERRSLGSGSELCDKVGKYSLNSYHNAYV